MLCGGLHATTNEIIVLWLLGHGASTRRVYTQPQWQHTNECHVLVESLKRIYMYDLGTRTRVDQSDEKAAELFKMAADLGHSSAQLNLAYVHDQGVDQSSEKARER